MQKPPEAKKTNFTYDMHGETIADPYQWLEDRDDAKVKSWVKKQNEFTAAKYEDNKYEEIKKSLTEKFDYDVYSTPIYMNGYWRYGVQKPDEEQMVLYRSMTLSDKKEVLIDPNKFEYKATLASVRVNRDWQYMAYETTTGGSEETQIIIRELDTGTDRDDEVITGCRGASPVWRSDAKGFYYTKPEPTKRTKAEPFYHYRVYYHQLGARPSSDLCIFGDGFDKEYSFGIAISVDDKYLLIRATKGWKQSQLFLYDIGSKKHFELMSDFKGRKGGTFLKDKIIIKSNHNAPNNKIDCCTIGDVLTNNQQWETLIKEHPKYVLESYSLTSQSILCEYLYNVASIVRVYDYNGNYHKDLDIPKLSSLTAIGSNRNESMYCYSYSNFLQSNEIVEVNDAQNQVVYKKSQHSLASRGFEAKQEWYEADDGTKIPMFVIRKKSLHLDSTNPTILYTYGGYGSSELPAYNLLIEDYIREGGIFAVANIRGGGEFGQSWHEAGSGKNKLNSLNDIISAAEYLVKKKYTSANRLAILGGSNGGMNVLACTMLRPELFGAVVSRVPLSDLYRFPDFLIASRWAEEWGDPRIKDQFAVLKKWSPYHNIKKQTEYPPLLITTGYNDSRVHPMHSFKMTALMQEYGKECYLYADFEGGHGAANVRAQRIASQALVLRFLSDKIG